MVTNASVQCNGGLLPDIILLTLCVSIGEPFEYHVEFLSLQSMFPPKPFDRMEGLYAFRFFFQYRVAKKTRSRKKIGLHFFAGTIDSFEVGFFSSGIFFQFARMKRRLSECSRNGAANWKNTWKIPCFFL